MAIMNINNRYLKKIKNKIETLFPDIFTDDEYRSKNGKIVQFVLPVDSDFYIKEEERKLSLLHLC